MLVARVQRLRNSPVTWCNFCTGTRIDCHNRGLRPTYVYYTYESVLRALLGISTVTVRLGAAADRSSVTSDLCHAHSVGSPNQNSAQFYRGVLVPSNIYSSYAALLLPVCSDSQRRSSDHTVYTNMPTMNPIPTLHRVGLLQ